MDGRFIFLGFWYDVELVDSPIDVDKEKRKALFGQIDIWEKVCRLYKSSSEQDVKRTWMHEIVHLIVDFINSEAFNPPDAEIDQFVDLWFDTLDRNKLLVKDWRHIIGVK